MAGVLVRGPTSDTIRRPTCATDGKGGTGSEPDAGSDSGLVGLDRDRELDEIVRLRVASAASGDGFASSGTRLPYSSPFFFVEESPTGGALAPNLPRGVGTAPFLSKLAILSFKLPEPKDTVERPSPWADALDRC